VAAVLMYFLEMSIINDETAVA